MTDAQQQKLMRLLLGARSLRSNKWLAEMDRRQRKAKRTQSLTRKQVMEKHGISGAEIRAEANWWKRANGS